MNAVSATVITTEQRGASQRTADAPAEDCAPRRTVSSQFRTQPGRLWCSNLGNDRALVRVELSHTEMGTLDRYRRLDAVKSRRVLELQLGGEELEDARLQALSDLVAVVPAFVNFENVRNVSFGEGFGEELHCSCGCAKTPTSALLGLPIEAS